MRCFSVVIPAYNEAAVVGRCIERLLEQQELGQLEIVVVPNGCRDDTAEIARGFGDGVTVIELEQGSKINALNAGDEACTLFPRVYLDADIELSIDCLARCYDALRDGCMAVSPTAHFVTKDSGFIIRNFYQAWMRTPYHSDGHMLGSGFYAMSEEGRARFDCFPPIIADDGFAHQLFSRDERRTLTDCTFNVFAPKTLKGLIAIKTRARLGMLELAAKGYAPREEQRERTTPGSMFTSMLRHPVSSSIYIALKMITRIRANQQFKRSRFDVWERDESARDG
jgi:glycosyltransferase involved in cell wall biosynthesis